MIVDTTFNVYSDARGGDPDSTSPTLRKYHKILWSKPLRNGKIFELSDNEAIELLWAEFNPRCEPVYDRSNVKHVFQYQHKVEEARSVPFDKPSGWLLADVDGDVAGP